MWDERYATEDYAYGEAPNDFLVEQGWRIPPGPVLCLAEGEGRNAVWLASRGHGVTAVDASAVGLEKAARLAETQGVAIRCEHADLADYHIAPGKWAGIVSIFAHTPPKIRRRVHRQVVAGLKPGGVFLLEAYTPRQLEYRTGGPPVAEMMMELSSLEAELEGLTFDIAREREREIREGRYHTGPGHVVQVVARRAD
ncbi:SAM-dependent methyltransferase [Arhodomonas sp. SL1]|uniref:SAM-dependent methyltransferase n=1 Tax=Arhodomonas sp. SL1 TaxID=3425691 RepID=UPI003F8818B7